MSDRSLVLYTEPLVAEAVEWLHARCDVVQCDADDARFDELLGRAVGLIVRTYLRVDEALLKHAPNLKVVGRAGIGLDNIDVQACRRNNIEVVYTPEASTQAVVEYVVALILDLLRPRTQVTQPVDMKQWGEMRRTYVGRRQLSECTVGILGLGRIGKRFASILQPFGCRVIYNDITNIAVEQRCGASPISVEQLFTESDIITLHIDGRTSNRHFVDAELLALLKPDVQLINTCRGFVVDPHALASALCQRPDARAMIDVHEPEPPGEEYPLFDVPNAALLPHLASRTHTGLANMSWVVRDVDAVLRGDVTQFPAPK